MLVKKQKKNSFIILAIVFIIIFYYMLRVTTLVELNNGNWSFEIFSTCLNELYKIATPISFTTNNVGMSLGVAFFVLMLYETYKMQNKKIFKKIHIGSAEWKSPKEIKNKRDRDFENNMILTQTELVSKNMKKSGMNRHVILLGRPGTR